MYRNEQQIKFQGFHPTDFTKSYLREKLNQLLEESPYGATIKATFSKDGPGFKGFVAIYSSAGKFYGVSQGTRLKEVTGNLIDQIRRDLEKWKVKRFANSDQEVVA